MKTFRDCYREVLEKEEEDPIRMMDFFTFIRKDFWPGLNRKEKMLAVSLLVFVVLMIPDLILAKMGYDTAAKWVHILVCIFLCWAAVCAICDLFSTSRRSDDFWI